MSSTNASTIRTPQRQRGRERVAGLLAAATSAFVERGYEAATMTEIAARAGAAIGSLYLFFPTKAALAEALVASLAGQLSERLDALRASIAEQDGAGDGAGQDGAAIASALFDAFAAFTAEHPVYPILVELPGEAAWRDQVRRRRRAQVEALLAEARPPLPPAQVERLALIIPQLLALPLRLEPAHRRAVAEELRRMLATHLQRPAGG